MGSMRLVSWNVNGIRAVTKKGFWDWLEGDQPDLLCLQETRIQEPQLTDRMRTPEGYHAFWSHAQAKGYSGVATFSREAPLSIQVGFGLRRYDDEGRVLITQHSAFTLVNAYFPSGRRGLERVAFKIGFYDDLLAHCVELRESGQSLVVCGDLNTAHQPIDLARPRENRNTSGFLPEEREAMDRWLDAGFVDIFRHLHPHAQEYTWWTYVYDARARNIGWRIDYFLVTEDLMSIVEGASILGDVGGSDHCPIELRLSTSPGSS